MLTSPRAIDFVADVDLRGVNRSNRHGGILFLILTAQTNWRFDRKMQLQIAVARRTRRRVRESLFRHRVAAGRRDNGNSGLDDSRFFSRDFDKRLAQPFFMIEVDWRND